MYVCMYVVMNNLDIWSYFLNIKNISFIKFKETFYKTVLQFLQCRGWRFSISPFPPLLVGTTCSIVQPKAESGFSKSSFLIPYRLNSIQLKLMKSSLIPFTYFPIITIFLTALVSSFTFNLQIYCPLETCFPFSSFPSQRQV